MKMHKWHLRIQYLRFWQQSCWDSSLLALCQWGSGCWLFRTPGTAHTITASHPRRPVQNTRNCSHNNSTPQKTCTFSLLRRERTRWGDKEIHSSEPDTRACRKTMHLHNENAHLWCASAVPAEI
jgi:hypothetical protein